MDDNKGIVDLYLQGRAEGATYRAPITTPDGTTHIFVPEGYKLDRVPPLDPTLTRIKQHVVLHDADSFIEYIKRFSMSASQVFAEPGFLSKDGRATITAVLDYHDGPRTPDHASHVATYMPRYSEQWTRWVRTLPPVLKQAEFAEWVEENRADIVAPEAAKLLDIVRAFKASKKSEFNSVVYQPNGDVTLQYDERTEQLGSSGPLPELLQLGIPVYYRTEVYKVPVFVRFKVASGAVVFSLKPDRADLIEDNAFGGLLTRIAEATGLTKYVGRRGS